MRWRSSALAAMFVSVALLAAACSSDATTSPTPAPSTTAADPVAAATERVSTAEAGVTTAQDGLTSAHSDFCTAASGYVDTLDRYGHLFTDATATVGDVQTLGADLVEPKAAVTSAADAVETAKTNLATAQQELVDAQAALAAAVAAASTLPSTTEVSTTSSTTTTLVPPAAIARVKQAEQDLASAAAGITAVTPLVDAGIAYNSAALAVQVSWLLLMNDAACFTDEQHAKAVDQLTAYTTALQTDLKTAGYDPGAVDGVYGPATVAAVQQLQKDSSLPVTGLVDEATNRALQDKLDAAGAQKASQVVQLQTILTLAGYWTGPIDGVWTPELTAALKAFQTALGVPPTGAVDAATVAAFQVALAELKAGPPPTTTVAPTTAPSTPTTVPAAGASTVLVADSSLGKILTAANGMTVYLFVPDAQGAPTCVDACATNWPPLTVDDASKVTGGAGVDAKLLSTATHPLGTQVTYNGWPLYFFKGDAKPGDTNGQGQGGKWFVIDATGNAVGKP